MPGSGIQESVARLAAAVATPSPALRGVRAHSRAALARGATDEAGAHDREVFVRLVFFGWLLLGLASIVVIVLAGVIGAAVGGTRGRHVGVAFGTALGIGCVVGVVMTLPSVLRARFSAGGSARSRAVAGGPLAAVPARGSRPRDWFVVVQVVVAVVVLLGMLANA